MPAKEDRRPLRWTISLGLLLLISVLCLAAAGVTQPADATPANAAAFAPIGGTPTPTPTACTVSYTYITSTASIVTATDLIPGSQCGRCTATITLPFPFTFYGQTYTTANVLNAGNVQFVTTDTSNNSCPPPYAALGPAILPAWDTVLDTGQPAICQAILGRPCGVYTSVTGIAPDRIFNIEWVARRSGSSTYTYHFELRLYESTGVLDFVYAGLIPPPSGANSSVGVQNGTSAYTYFACQVPNAIYQGLMIRWNPSSCGPPYTPTLTSTPTSTPTQTWASTPTSTRTPTFTSTATSTGSSTGTPVGTTTATPTPATCESAWRVVYNPNASTLYSVAALSFTDVWAVGVGGPSQMTQHWDGSGWTPVPIEFPGTFPYLYAVAGLSANDVWAAGGYGHSGLYVSLIEHWNGTAWSVVPSFTGSDYFTLYGLAAIAPNDVWAVGGGWVSGVSGPVTEHWNGTAWSIVPNPALPGRGTLLGVAAVSSNDVWAVGGYYDQGVVRTLTEHWDGSAWSIVSSPSAALDSRLKAVAAHATNDVWAVGYYFDGSFNQTLIEHWDGAQWSVVSSPYVGSEYSALNGIAVVSANDVWAVGFHGPIFNANQMLVEHWDGTQWSTAPIPNPIGTVWSELLGVVAVSTNDVWAVGYPRLTERYTYACMFSDVHTSDYFYEAVRYLYNHGVISGYADNTFRPYNTTTRGQLCKIIVAAKGWGIYTPPSPTFQDVPTNHTFYQYIETAYSHAIISGYACGTGCLEFRPGANVTRAQLCKIIVLAEDWALYAPPTPTFRDVPRDDPFYAHIETAYSHAIISGYTCGPTCLEFRPNANATRGQICKIVYNAVTAP